MVYAKMLAACIVLCLWTASLQVEALSTVRQTSDISLSAGDVDVGSDGLRSVHQSRNYHFDSDTWLHTWRAADPIRNQRPASKRSRRQSGDRRLQRAPATSAPLQGLSLLDLPVFSRGDRPSSMDKTLGAIFSKVAFSAATNQTGAKNEVFDSNANSSASAKLPPAESGAPSAGSAVAASSTTEATTTTSLSSSSSASTTTAATIRPKPVFELDTRVFDFIPYERTAPPPNANQRLYNPNVPGLRGPSRINTARNPADPAPNQPFNLRPTIPPLLIDLTSSTVRTTTSPTTTTTSSTTQLPPGRDEDGDDDDETAAPTTTPAMAIKTSTTTSTTTTTSTSTTTTTTAAPVPTSAESEDNAADGSDYKRQSSDKNRETAWSFQIYGTSSLFALLGMFALSNLLRLRTATRRLLSTSHCLSIQLLVLFLAITRSIHLLYDAYNHKRLLPPALAFCIFNVAFPCLSSALAVLLLAMFKATKLQILPGVIVKPALWAALVAFHFALSLSIDIVVGSVGGLFSLHLASQAYFVLWSLALSLGYFAAFAPAIRAAKSLQAETMRATLTALHIHGASLPRRLPRPTLLRAVRVTLIAAVFALLVAAFQLYGMFGVYGLPWRQQPSNNQGLGSSSSVSSAPVVLTPEFLARYQGMQRDRNLNVDALRQVLGLTNEPRGHDHKRDPWPVAPENFWPWWTYQLIARVLEFLMAALIAYVASQPLRHNEVLTEKNVENASKKGSLWLFTAGKSLKSGSMETLSTLCCQTNKGARARDMGNAMSVAMNPSELSPVKSMASDELNYSGPNTRNYCYSNPTQVSMTQMDRPSMPLPRDQHSHAGTLPSFPIVYGSKRSQQRRCASTLSHNQISSVLVNDNGFIRFREGAEQEETYEDVDRTRSPTDNHQHIYQELGHKAQSVTYYSTSTSSMTSSSANTHKCSGTATTPSTCTYEHMCRRGLAGYYEPQRYEMQLPNAQLLSLLAKDSCHVFQPNNIYGSQRSQPPACQHCHCKETSNCLKSPNYESYGPKPEAQTPAPTMQVSMQSDVHQVHQESSCSLMESYVHMLLAEQAKRKSGDPHSGTLASSEVDLQLAMARLHPSQLRNECRRSGHPQEDDAIDHDDEATALHPRHHNGSNNDIYISQCASTCSSESAGNSFDMRLYPHLTPPHQLYHLIHHHHHLQPQQVRNVVVSAHEPPASDAKTLPCSSKRIVDCAQAHQLDRTHPSHINQSPPPPATVLDDSSPDSAIAADRSDILEVDGRQKTAATATASTSSSSPLSSIFRLGSFPFRRPDTTSNGRVDSNGHPSTSLKGKFFQRLASSATGGGRNMGGSVSLHPNVPLQMYGYSRLVGSDDNVHHRANISVNSDHGSLRRSTSQKTLTVASLKDLEVTPCGCNSVHLPTTAAAAAEAGIEYYQNQPGLGPQYWLSRDLLRQHSEQLNDCAATAVVPSYQPPTCNVAQATNSTFKLCDAISTSDERRAPCVPAGHLEALDKKSESTSSIASSSAASASEKKMLIPSRFSLTQVKDCQDRGLSSLSSDAQAESAV